MTFECDGVRYESGELITLQTGQEHTPLVLATRDYAQVFVAEVNRWAGVDVRRARPEEVETWIADLRRAGGSPQ
jgi:hypothetical protein